jgi:hypothetical protein
MTLIWERSGDVYYATVRAPVGEARVHLVVESDGNRWDWTAWRPGEDLHEARRGVAGTVQEAMWDAERAASA